MELERVSLWRGDTVSIKQLADDFARYLYLPHLKGPDVLLESIHNGLTLTSWEQVLTPRVRWLSCSTSCRN